MIVPNENPLVAPVPSLWAERARSLAAAFTFFDAAAVGWSAMLASDGFDSGRELAHDQRLQLNFGAGVIDVDADEVPVLVVVEHDAVRDLPALDTRLLGQVDVQRIGVRMIVDLHGLNRRSGKAL